MKIALIRQRYVSHGGAERYLNGLVSELSRRGHEVHIFANEWDKQAVEAKNVILHRVPMIRALSFLRALSFAFCCKRAVEIAGCDLVFSLERTLRQNIYRAGDGCHREWLVQRRYHATLAKRVALRLNPFHAAMLWLEKRMFSPRNTRIIIANSERGKEEIIYHYGFPAEKIHVIHNGVDCERFKPIQRGKTADSFVLLFVGTGWERKGLEFCIRALPHLPVNVRLQVVGKGNTRRYFGIAEKLGVAERVEFLGTAADMAKVYAEGDLLVLPAIYEPFANVCLEAMASGLPVVTSLINGASEVIVDGENGAVVEEPNDVDALAAAIVPFLDRGVLAVASAHARKTAESLPFAGNVEKTLEVIAEAVGSR